MELNKSNIICKTHYGLNIFTYVLRQFYPNVVLSLSGRDCGITQNPFNENKPTLAIKIVNGCAVFFDKQKKDLKGDVFDFAQMFFESQKEEDLLQKINTALQLNLKTNNFDDLAWLNDPDDTWYTDCSFFQAPVRNVFPSSTLRLHQIYDFIKSKKYKAVTEELRSITDPKEKRKFKANRLDYVTFSGVFERRNDKFLIKHSSLITIDFDHLENLEKVRTLLLQDPYFDTEMLFTSPSGDGIKWIIKINLKEATHAEYFQAVSNYIKSTYHLEVDASGKDVSRACFLPHDANAYLHKRHKIL